MAEDVDFRDAGKMRIGRPRAGPEDRRHRSAAAAPAAGGPRPRCSSTSTRAPSTTPPTPASAPWSTIVNRFRFNGTVEILRRVDQDRSASRATRGSWCEGIPLDVFPPAASTSDQKVAMVYVTSKIAGGFEARYRMALEEGIELGAKVHQRAITAGPSRWARSRTRSRTTTSWSSASARPCWRRCPRGPSSSRSRAAPPTGWPSSRTARSASSPSGSCSSRGIDLVLEGKFYGSSGSRRAHFKIYSTLTGKLLGEPKFETSL